MIAVLVGMRSVRAENAADPLAELAALGQSMVIGPEGGGSIRAKKAVDLSRMDRMQKADNLEGKVELIKTGAFPVVAVRIRVTKTAAEGAGKEIPFGASVVIVPELKVMAGHVAMNDENTRINAGAFYLQEGDKVVVRVTEQASKVWKAAYIERK